MKVQPDDMNDELLIKHMLGEATAEEQENVEQWLRARPANQKVYDHVVLIWEKSLEVPSTRQVDAGAAWDRFRSVISTEGRNPDALKRVIGISPFGRNDFLRVAAIFILLIGGAFTGYFLFKSPANQIVSTNEKALVKNLSDGSIVTLNSHSSLSHPKKFRGNNREVNLKGEAFFDIKPDKTKPFIIHANEVDVKVVGTSFNIKTINGKTEIIVETGVVEVSYKSKMLRLSAGQKIITSITDDVLAVEKVTDKLYNYYRSKEFVCDNTPLWKLVEVLNQAYDADIIIERKELRTLPLTTTFSNEPLENILAVIQQTFAITVERRGKQIILK
ncbi:MAG: FecR domain-containing protein [Gemmatimonadaceae bacterium]|nr:FecR domain-containing protein [Chitinophagaceae bacterium]